MDNPPIRRRIRRIPTGPARQWPWSPPDSPNQPSCPGLPTTTPTNVAENAPAKSPDEEAITAAYLQALVSLQTLPFESTSTSNLSVPTGFVSAPQAVVPPPGSMSRATSQGQPPPLFTPGPNNSQNLTSFPSPQIPTSNIGASGPAGVFMPAVSHSFTSALRELLTTGIRADGKCVVYEDGPARVCEEVVARYRPCPVGVWGSYRFVVG